jgi:hypothetical protein
MVKIEKVGVPPDEAVRPPEASRIRTMFSDIDREVVRRLTERYGSAVPPERIQKIRDVPILVEGRPEFDRAFKRTPGESHSDGKVLGFALENSWESPHVALDQNLKQFVVTDAHERLHQLADPKAKSAMRDHFYEGMTEHLARDITRPLGGQSDCYEAGVTAVENVERKIGRDVVENAYLKGDMETLIAKLGEAMGIGAVKAFGEGVKDWKDLPDTAYERESK